MTVDQLERLIKKHQDAYYSSEAEISDEAFDALWDELKQRYPESPLLQKIGADVVDGFPKVRHIMPMGSQDKAANDAEFTAWARKLNLPAFIVQFKLDGASLELQYEKGVLVHAVTRGDGLIGGDIISNALKMRGVVRKMRCRWTGGVRGEVLMFRDVWRAKYAEKANCRNAANGIMRRKDGAGCEDLAVISYDAAASGNDTFFSTESEKLLWLAKRGFEVAPAKEFNTIEKVLAYRKKTAAVRMELPFDIDGLVVKDITTDMNDLRNHRPERQIAFKFELEKAVSILRAVEWSESGATYTPIGIVDPVRLAGTTVKRANLNNPDSIRNKGLEIGSAVVIVKRGEIIPKIEGLAEVKRKNSAPSLFSIEFPSVCGECNSTLVDSGTRLYCPNPFCPKRLLHRLEKWVSVLNIQELGVKLIKQLFERGNVRHIADLYRLNPAEIAEYDRMGEVSAAKVVRNIMSARALTLSVFVAGFDIEGTGETIMEKVVAAGFDTLKKLRAAQAEELAAIYGLGDITARTIIEGLAETAADMDATLAQGIISIAPPAAAEKLSLTGKSFCFTGELRLMKRGDAEAKVKAAGGSAKTSIVKGLSYLVTNNPESGSSKNQKARELGITIINEQEFIALLEAGV